MPDAAEESNLRTVLDSNVLVSAFAFPGGTPYQIVQLLMRGDIMAVVSSHILAEVEEVLRGKLRVPDGTVRGALDLLLEHCALVDPEPTASVAGISLADNQVLDCAIAGDAQFLVTGDRGIQQLEMFEGVAIVSPRQFLEILRSVERQA